MKKLLIGLCVIFLFTLLCVAVFAEVQKPEQLNSRTQFSSYTLNQTDNVEELKRKCIDATIEGILLDRKQFKNWLENYDEKKLTDGSISLEEIRSRLAKLEVDLKKYKTLTLDSYQLPKKIELEAWVVGEGAKKGGQIHGKFKSKSGPFYHIAGINGDNYGIIETNPIEALFNPKNKYLMIIYLVYPKYYPFPNYYIYIDSLKKE